MLIIFHDKKDGEESIRGFGSVTKGNLLVCKDFIEEETIQRIWHGFKNVI